jgi:hypothetical protein
MAVKLIVVIGKKLLNISGVLIVTLGIIIKIRLIIQEGVVWFVMIARRHFSIVIAMHEYIELIKLAKDLNVLRTKDFFEHYNG